MNMRSSLRWMILFLFLLSLSAYAQSPVSGTLKLTSEGAGDTRAQAVNTALSKAISGQLQKIAHLPLAERKRLETQLNRSRDQIVTAYRVLSETQNGPLVGVVIEASLLASRLVEPLYQEGLTRYLTYQPRVLILIDETLDGEPVPQPVLAGLVRNAIGTEGIQVVLPPAGSVPPIHDIQDWQTFGDEQKADMVIVGTAHGETLGTRASYYSVQVEASLSAILCATSEVLADWHTPTRSAGLGPTPRRALERAYRGPRDRHLKEMARTLTTELLSRWLPLAVSNAIPTQPHEVGTPPRILWSDPEEGAVFAEDRAPVRGYIVSESGLARWQLFLDGTEVPVTEAHWSEISPGEYQFRRNVPLTPGEHTLKLTAVDTRQRRSEQTRRVIYQPPPDLQADGLQITNPMEGTVTRESWVHLNARLPGQDDGEVQVFVNRKPLPVEKDRHLIPMGDNRVLDYVVPLDPGSNLIRIATESGGEKAEAFVRVYRETEGPSPRLTVHLFEPQDGEVVDAAEVRVRGSVAGTSERALLTYELNGRTLPRQRDLTLVPLRPAGGSRQAEQEFQREIRLQQGENRIRVIAEAGGETAVAETRVILSDLARPRIVIESPEDDISIQQPDIQIRGYVLSPSPAPEIRCFVNGSERSRSKDLLLVPGKEEERAGFFRVPFSYRTPLAPGKNTIRIAMQQGSSVLSATRNVTRIVSTEPASPVTGGTKYAVLIGISQYQDPRIPSLAYPRVDAMAVDAALSRTIPDENRWLLTDSEATREKILRVIGVELAGKLKPEDVVYLYYSGHGGLEPDFSNESADGYDKYIVPYDSDRDSLYTTAIRNAELSDLLNRLRCQTLIFFIDSCYSGGATQGITGVHTIAPAGVRADSSGFGEFAGKGRVVISASQAGEVAFEVEELGHSIFTCYLVEALHGAADQNGDGQISLFELYPYVVQRVSEYAARKGVSQVPTLLGSVVGDLTLIELR